MAVRAGHRHLRFARLSGRHFAVALTPRGIGNMSSHLAALGTLDAPLPLTGDDLQLFGRHSNLLAAPAADLRPTLALPPMSCSLYVVRIVFPSLPGLRVAIDNMVAWTMRCIVYR